MDTRFKGLIFIRPEMPRMMRGFILAVICLLALAGIVSADTQTIELCFDSTGPGQNVSGVLPGQTSNATHWAGVFNTTLKNGGQSTSPKAFCTDISNGIAPGKCYANSTLGSAEPLVACTLQNYPPLGTLSNSEAAARQAAVWHYSDSFTLANSDGVKARYDQIIADIDAKFAAGECATVQNPSIAITPVAAVNFLASDGNGGYLPSAHEFTITVLNGTQPVVGKQVTVSTSLGTFADLASPITVTTDANGQAKVSVKHNAPGTATITAVVKLTLPTAIRIDPGANIQKIAFAGGNDIVLVAKATKDWVPGGNLVIRKYQDKNMNGKYDTGDLMIDWQIRYRVHSTPDINPWTSKYLKDDGTNDGSITIGVDPTKTYDVCEYPLSGWLPTEPPGAVGVEACYEQVQANSTVWFGNVDLPALKIEKYHDLNGNGVWDVGETGLDGFGFQIDRYESNLWKATYSGVTSNGGKLNFTGILNYYDYRITEEPLSGWYVSTTNPVYLTVDQVKTYSVSFGNVQPGDLTFNKSWLLNGVSVPPPVGASASVCIKRTGPGVPPTSAPTPKDSAGNPIAAGTDGYYCQALTTSTKFTDLWPGTYDAYEAPLPGWTGPSPISGYLILSGDSKIIDLTNSRESGSLEVTKVVDWKGVTPDPLKTFSVCITGPSYPTLNCKTVGAPTWKASWTDLNPGLYTVSETAPGPEWSVTGGGPVTVVPGQQAAATVTNTYNPGSLEVTKVVDWKGVTPDPLKTFSVCITGPSYTVPNCKTVGAPTWKASWTSLIPGLYTVSETAPGPEWSVTGGGPVTVVPGQQAASTVTNTYNPGSLEVTKVVDWKGVTPDPLKTFSICITGPSYPVPNCKTVGAPTWKASWTSLIPGLYTVSETAPGPEWSVTGGGPVTVVPGQQAAATVTNTYNPGSLEVTKVVDWKGVTPDPLKTFSVCITGPSYTVPNCKTVGAPTWKASWTSLIPGLYTVSETAPGPEWSVTGGGPVTVVPGQQAASTVTNTYNPGSLEVTKVVDWKGVTPDPLKTFSICITGPSYPVPNCNTVGAPTWKASWTSLIPGLYTVSETAPGPEWSVTGGGPVTVAPGQQAAATVTNTYNPGSLEVTKVVDWKGAAPDPARTFEICITGPSYPTLNCKTVSAPTWKASWMSLIPGLYTVSENAPGPEWSVTGGGPVTVVPGQQATSTVTNAYNLGSLEVTKVVDWKGVTPDTTRTFEICIEGPMFQIPRPMMVSCKTVSYAGGVLRWDNLLPGEYVVRETDPGSQWSVVVTGGLANVSAGQTAQAGVTNTYALGALEVTKTVDWNGVLLDETVSFEICIAGPSYPTPNCKTVGPNGGAVLWTDLIPGQYTVTEKDPGGEWAAVVNGSPAGVVSGQTALAGVTNTHRLGSVEIIKTVLWKDKLPLPVNFRICLAGPNNFHECAQFGQSFGWSHRWDNLIPGNYSVYEADPGDGWDIAIDRPTLNVFGNEVVEVVRVTNTYRPPTAVELTSFTATPLDSNTVRVDWITAAEINNLGFYLYRSKTQVFADATEIHFEPAASVNGGGASYTHTDQVPESGHYWYWLVDVDTNGVRTLHSLTDVTLQEMKVLPFRVYLPMTLR